MTVIDVRGDRYNKDMLTVVPLLTWGQWLTSPGFGGSAAVVAAVITFVGVRRAAAVQRENARRDQWWDRLKWAVDLALSDDEATANAGLEAMRAITETEGFDDDELNFIAHITDLFLLDTESGTLEQDQEDADGHVVE